MNEKAVILLSGGLDSTTVLAIAQSKGYECYALTFNYGQRHHIEIEKTKKIVKTYKVKAHKIINLDLRALGHSALTDDIAVPKSRSEKEMTQNIPVTYVPARNTIFLSYALAWAEVLQADHIFIGVNVLDYSGYPDCRPEYIKAFQNMARLATRASVSGQKISIHTPLLYLTKAHIIRKGLELGVDYGLTHSCYDPDPRGAPCGECDSCLLRAKGFTEAKQMDPALLFFE
ncbi:MAG TPA: 7-cyano-7-deazaguanine synthase QueC [Bdellovibrionota bacterium]|nr:7-cyano-7-deazaguanine synthase QueC [Bdellovibrionota bacterium]